MLLTPSGDNGSSLPVDLLQALPPSGSLVGQNGIEGDRGTAASPLETLVENYQAPPPTRDVLSSIGLWSNADGSSRSVGHTTKEPTPAMPQSLHQTAWSTLPFQERDLDGLYALRKAATLKAGRQLRSHSRSKRSLSALPDANITADSINLFSFAAPLSPLRERDLTALAEFFVRDDMPAIEADLSHRLLALLPEPCWEDDVFGFLKEFL